MELQFNKTVIPCLKSVIREVQNQELTQEVRLPDGMPDIGRVLASWGQLLVRGKEWRSSGMSASGGVMTWVLYQPEDGSMPQSIESWIPFQMKWDFPDAERDGSICVSPLLRGVDARSVSARKLMVRAGIGILGEAMVPGEAELYQPGELPEDVQLLKNTYPMQMPREAGEKGFNLEETLSLPATAPTLERLVRYELRPEVVEQKIVSDKIVFHGNAMLHILYTGPEGQLHSWDFEVPFSQFAQLDKEYDQDALARICLAVTGLELEQGQEESFNLRAGLTGQYVVYDRPMVELVQDAYSPVRTVVPQRTHLMLPAVLDSQSETLHPEGTIQMGGNAAVDVSFWPDHPRFYRDGDRVTGEMTGVFQALGYDDNGQPESGVSRWEQNWEMVADMDTAVEAVVQQTGKPQVTTGGDNASVRADLRLDAMATAQQGLPMVMGLEMSEAAEPDPNRPSLILRRAGTDELWDIAKQTGSTVEAIRNANNLQQEPDAEQMLLIPIS